MTLLCLSVLPFFSKENSNFQIDGFFLLFLQARMMEEIGGISAY